MNRVEYILKDIIETDVPSPKFQNYNQKGKWSEIASVMLPNDSVVVNNESEAGCLRSALLRRGAVPVQRRKEGTYYNIRIWRLK